MVCDCHLNWVMGLYNETQWESIRNILQTFTCTMPPKGVAETITVPTSGSLIADTTDFDSNEGITEQHCARRDAVLHLLSFGLESSIAPLLYHSSKSYNCPHQPLITNERERYEYIDKLVKYSVFQDIHVMIFIGFGFLMTFLKRYAFSSLGFNFLLGALMLQWSLICRGIYDVNEELKILISLESIINADITTCSVLISMGAVLGSSNHLQLLVMGVMQVIFVSLNIYVSSNLLQACDTGGSVVIHTFGAYFGMAVSYMLGREKDMETQHECSRYNSDIFSMIGTIFLWLYWPSFNGIALPCDLKYRAVINTYLSLASCCVTTFAVSSWLNPDHKFEMVHIQNSTLAGGVAIGSSVSLLVQPYGAVFVGMLAGIVSVIGYVKLTPWLNEKWKIHDTCGVHNLHGLPGILGGLVGAFMACIALESEYGDALHFLYPARSNFHGRTTNLTTSHSVTNLKSRDAFTQGGFQILSMIVTIVISLVSGILTGILISIKGLQSSSKQFFIDDPFWKMDYELTSLQTPPPHIQVKPSTQSTLPLFPTTKRH